MISQPNSRPRPSAKRSCQSAKRPTVPQLYIKGQFIGGSDIMAELHQKGELQKLVAEAQGGAPTA